MSIQVSAGVGNKIALISSARTWPIWLAPWIWKRLNISVKREKECRTRTCASSLSQRDTSCIKLSTGGLLSWVYYQRMEAENASFSVKWGLAQFEQVHKELSATIKVTIHSFKFYWAGPCPSQHNKMVKAELLKRLKGAYPEQSAQRLNIAIQSGYSMERRPEKKPRHKQPWLGASVFRSTPWCVSWAQKS